MLFEITDTTLTTVVTNEDIDGIRSDVDVKSERKLAQSQNHKEKTRDGEGERGGDTGG